MPIAKRQSSCCCVYRLCETLSRKWAMLILRSLNEHGTMRFSAIIVALPDINSRMLSERLTELESEGLIRRAVQGSKPITVTYEMTEKGRDLRKIFDIFELWKRKWGEGASQS